MRLFEVSDVILLSEAKGCGAANSRRLVAVHCDRAASFEVIHGLLNRVMEVLAVPYTGARAACVPGAMLQDPGRSAASLPSAGTLVMHALGREGLSHDPCVIPPLCRRL